MPVRRPASLLRRPVAELARRLLPPPPPALRELERQANEAGPGSVDRAVGRFLEGLAATAAGGSILQLGAARPAVTHWLARGSVRSSIAVVDPNEPALAASRAVVEGIGPAERFGWIAGSPSAEAERSDRAYALVVVDRPPAETRRLIDLVLPRVTVGGTIAALGALRDLFGEGDEAPPRELAALDQLRPYVMIHPQLAASLVPLGDGLLVAVKRRETIRELGGPY